MRRSCRELDEYCRLVEQTINDGVFDWDLRSNRLGCSEQALKILGRSDDPPPDWNSLLVLVHPDDQAAFRAILFACACGERDGFEQDCRILHGRGYFIWLGIRAVLQRDTKGRARRVVGSLADQTDFRIAQGQLAHAHQRDRLTGLPNRRSLIQSMDAAFERFQRDPRKCFSAIFLDLDRFKFINDSFGHDAGDLFIRKVAKRLQVYQGETDMLARIGGDEFALLLTDTRDVGQLRHVADGILVMLSLPIILNGHKVYPAASIGGAVSARGDEDAEEILKHAEAAMFQAKGMGKARYEIYEPGINIDSAHILSVDTELRQALERNEMRLFYQPVLGTADRRIIGFEALMRWEHPGKGLLAPAHFITIAEETGIIVQLGEWALMEAARQYKEWKQAGFGDLHIAINFSARQFEQKNLLSQIRKVLGRSGMPIENFFLEVTESVAMGNIEHSLLMLHEIRELGTTILIDDFGTGYSSFSYLKRLPLDILKIDKSFIDEIGVDDQGRAIVRAIMAMAHSLGLKVVAEGVEDEVQYRYLAGIGCDYIQGYYVSRPLPAAEAGALLASTMRTWPWPGTGAAP